MGIRASILYFIGKQQGNLIKHLEPVHREGDRALYLQVMRDFGFMPAPVLLHSPSPDLFAGSWMILRETMFTGRVTQVLKESVSLAVSSHNRCPFCEGSHAMALEGLRLSESVGPDGSGPPTEFEDLDRAQLVAWAKANLDRDEAIPEAPPFSPEQAAEIIGTIVLFQYLNRVVNVFLKNSPLPGPTGFSPWKKALERVGARVFKNLCRIELEPGASLGFLPEAILPADLAWAAASPNVAGAFARFDRAAESVGRTALSEEVRQIVSEYVKNPPGGQRELGKQWLDEATGGRDLSDREVALCRLALMSAFVSYQVVESDMEAARREGASDEDLLATVAWASFAQAKRIGSRLSTAIGRGRSFSGTKVV